MMEHAAKAEIAERRGENPEFYDSLSARLEKIIQDRASVISFSICASASRCPAS